MAYEVVLDARSSASWWYVGQAEAATFEFSAPPEQVPGVDWLIKQVVPALAEAIASDGGTVLRTQLSMDTAEWWRSKWTVKVWAHASPLAWNIVIPLFLILLIGVVVSWTLSQVEEMGWQGMVTVAIGGAVALGTLFVVLKLTK